MTIRVAVIVTALQLARAGAPTGANGAVTATDLDGRLRAFSQRVRCLVCQNESLADSRADLAADLRRVIREQMAAGRADSEIEAFLTARYGDFVLYRPPLRPGTYLLWFGPLALLASGLLVIRRTLTTRALSGLPRPLTEAEHRRARALLRGPARSETAR